MIEECQGGQGGLPNLGSFLAGIKSFFDFTINIIYKDVRFWQTFLEKSFKLFLA